MRTNTLYIFVLIVISLALYLYWQRIQGQKIDNYNQEIQRQLVELTEKMKVEAESSSAEFEIWAELNDLVLEKVTEYYNGSNEPPRVKYENSNTFIFSVNKKIDFIQSSNSHHENLRCYIQELKPITLSN